VFVELDTRQDAGYTISLEWDRDKGQTQIVVADIRDASLLVFPVQGANAGDAIHSGMRHEYFRRIDRARRGDGVDGGASGNFRKPRSRVVPHRRYAARSSACSVLPSRRRSGCTVAPDGSNLGSYARL